MSIKQLYNDNLRKLPNEYGDVSVMPIFGCLKSVSLSIDCFVCYKALCLINFQDNIQKDKNVEMEVLNTFFKASFNDSGKPVILPVNGAGRWRYRDF